MGLVYDEWDRNIHLVDHIDIPHSATRYRAIDHATRGYSAALWCAVFPIEGELFWYVYKCYKDKDSNIGTIVNRVIELSGNKRIKLEKFEDHRTQIEFTRYKEVFKSERYHKTLLDSRSFGSADAFTNREIGWLYKVAGLQVSPASGRFSEHQVQAVKELLEVKPDRKHPITGKMGCSRLIVDASLAQFKEEMEQYVWDDWRSGDENRNEKQVPRKKNDHLMNCLAYLAQAPMRYYGDMFVPEEEDSKPVHYVKRNVRCKSTGY